MFSLNTMLVERKDLRNIAIIAHVDHGKTTLVDGLLRQAHTFRDNQRVAERVMDSNDLERERGITILAKNTAITYKTVKINIVDTPGHADFGGEVERVMNMVDGVLLLVDAFEGPMPQTRFVLRKALEMGHRAIVVINKVDRKNADPAGALNRTFDLFIELGASDQQADFPVIYTNALTQQAGLTSDLTPDYQPLFEAILQHIPPPKVDPEAPAQMLVTTLSYDDYKGLIAVGRLFNGHLRAGQPIARIQRDGHVSLAEARYLYVFQGLQRVPVESAEAGEIVALAGLDEVHIGETIGDPENPVALPTIHVEAPTVRMTFGANTSPFAGREGTHVTGRKLRERLYAELERDVALRVADGDSPDALVVSGRGELHLAILIENLRREGYELQVSRPEVIVRTVDGERQEPYEQLEIEVSQDALGKVVEMVGQRRGALLDMKYREDGMVHCVYRIPTRGLLGFRKAFLTNTRGEGVMNTLFAEYGPDAGPIATRTFGSLVAFEPGLATTFGLTQAQERGTLFIGPGVEVYEGMVVGEHARERDLEVNVARKRHLTNMRSSTSEITVRLEGLRDLSLDDAIEFLADDELLEVTPAAFRIRKRVLSKHDRDRMEGRRKKQLALAT